MSAKEPAGQGSLFPRIVVFACNWCSYAGADTAGVSHIQYSPQIRVIRMMCSGRIHPAFVFKAFEKGADGVLITGCHFGDCHYISGNERAVEIFKIIEELAGLLGIERERLGLEWISAAEGVRFGQVMDDFVERVSKLGPLPKVIAPEEAGPAMCDIPAISRQFGTLLCYECGKCTGVCPVAREREGFSPRRTLRKALLTGDSLDDVLVCLTCGLCDARCPQDVQITPFIAAVREAKFRQEGWGDRPHGGIFQALGRLMTAPDLPLRHNSWVPDDLRTDPEGETLLYVGCAPFFDAFFTDLGAKTLDAARGALKILNHLGIEPRVLADERCCGHDFYWGGDVDTFRRLALINKEQIERSGVSRVVFTCPECLSTFKDLYPKVGVKIEAELISITQLMAQQTKDLELGPLDRVVTFQDPCRLARHLGDTDSPREVIGALPGTVFKEMAHAGVAAICCAGNSWNGCDAITKTIQVKRLKEASNTGADLLVTACPKCEIHLKCALKGLEEPGIEIRDLTGLIAEAMAGEGAQITVPDDSRVEVGRGCEA